MNVDLHFRGCLLQFRGYFSTIKPSELSKPSKKAMEIADQNKPTPKQTETTNGTMKITNENKQPSAMQNLISSAAGVAAGSAIGHSVGKALANKIGPHSSEAVEAISSSSKTNEEICSSEIRKFFECASQNKNLETCKIFHSLMLECQQRHQLANVHQTELN